MRSGWKMRICMKILVYKFLFCKVLVMWMVENVYKIGSEFECGEFDW